MISRLRKIENLVFDNTPEKFRARVESFIDEHKQQIKKMRLICSAYKETDGQYVKDPAGAWTPERFESEWPEIRRKYVEHSIRMETDPDYGPAYRRSLGIMGGR